MLTCSHVREHMSEALDGDLEGPYAAYVWLHGRVCPPCRRVRRSLERTRELLRRLRDEAPDPPTDASV